MPSEEPGHGEGAIPDLDPVVHSPARFAIMRLLQIVKKADFLYLERQTGLTRGNLSTHLSKLETAGYITIEKIFVGKVPRTQLYLTAGGIKAISNYREQMSKVLEELPE
jgi:DNA-binding MarR family transcriptional regulator